MGIEMVDQRQGQTDRDRRSARTVGAAANDSEHASGGEAAEHLGDDIRGHTRVGIDHERAGAVARLLRSSPATNSMGLPMASIGSSGRGPENE